MKSLRCATLLFAVFVCGQHAEAVEQVAKPEVRDSDLQLSLLASEPEVVTPTGLVADEDGRLFVVVSHTHARGAEYDGPESDQVLVFEDTTGDGQLDRSRLYADGLRHALAIAFSQKGELYAVQMKSIVVLRDTNNDGECDSIEPVLTIETSNSNNHGVFLGLVFDDRNRMYVSLGNIGGKAYAMTGTDGVVIEGQGDTGFIVRCAADGSYLERFAHGFWNPPELKFDTLGRLLATDNDPDARGPNRVLHVIAGGEYGYKSGFGKSGLHPYCAWNGELPGTLPMIAGVGEAPVGVLDCNTSALPVDYADDLLVGVWGTHEVVRVRTKRVGASLRGTVEPLVVGGREFRPTNITATADGTVYIADWADRRYPVHGKGRIWRLSVKPDVQRLNPQRPFSKSVPSRLDDLRELDSEESFGRLVAAATDADPFVSSTAVTSLGRPVYRDRVFNLLSDRQATNRLTGLLTLAKADAKVDADALRRLLSDSDADVRKMALIWAGESNRRDLAEAVGATLKLQTDSAELFETFLATMELFNRRHGKDSGNKAPGDQFDRGVDQSLIRAVLTDPSQTTSAKAMAVRYLTDLEDPKQSQILTRLLESGDDELAIEAIRTMASMTVPDGVQGLLEDIAQDGSRNPAVRCEALLSCLASGHAKPSELLGLLSDADPHVSLAAVRGLTQHIENLAVQRAYQAALSSEQSNRLSPAVLEQVQFALKIPPLSRPQSDDEWKAAVLEGGNAAAGRRVFFDRRLNCSKCHTVEGRGGRVGPDLSNVATAKTAEQILTSILHPSQEKSPDYQGYIVAMLDGRVLKGAQFHYRGESAEMLLEDGTPFRFKLSSTDEYRALDESLMPERLEEAMSVSEFRDLIAFLKTLGSVVRQHVD